MFKLRKYFDNKPPKNWKKGEYPFEKAYEFKLNYQKALKVLIVGKYEIWRNWSYAKREGENFKVVIFGFIKDRKYIFSSPEQALDCLLKFSPPEYTLEEIYHKAEEDKKLEEELSRQGVINKWRDESIFWGEFE